jgi:hypothetical protein
MKKTKVCFIVLFLFLFGLFFNFDKGIVLAQTGSVQTFDTSIWEAEPCRYSSLGDPCTLTTGSGGNGTCSQVQQGTSLYNYGWQIVCLKNGETASGIIPYSTSNSNLGTVDCASQLRSCVSSAGSSTSAQSACNNQYTSCQATAANSSANSSGLSNNQSSSTATGGTSCESNFENIGGVCFPTNTGLSNASISDIIENLLYWLMGIFTVLAIMAFVFSGIQYLTSAGIEERATTAKKNVGNSALGVLVGLSGFVIVRAIASALSGTSIFF